MYSQVDHKPKLIKVKIRSKKCLVSHCTVFSTDSKSLVIGTLEGKICVIDLDSPTATVKQIFRPHKENCKYMYFCSLAAKAIP